MDKKPEKKPPKKRQDKYDEKVKFEGTLEQMINIAVKTPPKKEAK
ncbi:MAG TPA: hypothetical protein VHA52_04520 [Candidatus Babeliaceae bacterium]|jgi:hypothetical protein|nr:hypothetical protein [Candidatus Babeliaceae bacterium]